MSEAMQDNVPQHQCAWKRDKVKLGTLPGILASRVWFAQAARQKKSAAVIFVDVVKAFDKVDREKLFGNLHGDPGILERAGVPSDICHLIASMHSASWLGIRDSDRRVRTRKGVRQGCVLGAALYMAFQADTSLRSCTAASAKLVSPRSKTKLALSASPMTLMKLITWMTLPSSWMMLTQPRWSRPLASCSRF